MSINPLDTLWPDQPAQQLTRKRRQFRRALGRIPRLALATVQRQYYIGNALADSRRALRANEDIGLSVIIISLVVSFAAISVLSNVIYGFVLAASALSVLLGANLLILVLMALGVTTASIIWMAALLQNGLSIALMEGATRKQNRSLRLTMRKSLGQATTTASTWFMLLAIAFGPAGVLIPGTLLVEHLMQHKLAGSMIYLIGMGAVSLGWALRILANYTLAPYVSLFEKTSGWQEAFGRSQKLVLNKGRLFILSGYAVFGLTLAGLYAIGLIVQALVHTDSVLIFLTLSIAAVMASNGVLTMFYRKRKLARK